jgi:hypothetical protein
MRTAILVVALALPFPAGAQDAEQDFKNGLKYEHQELLTKACRALVLAGRAEGATLVLSGFSKRDLYHDSYWILVRSAASFQTPEALQVVAQHVLEYETRPVARDLCFAMQANPSAEEAMCSILERETDELRVSVLDHLMDYGRKPALKAVIELMRKEGEKGGAPAVRKRCYRLLSLLSKGDHGEKYADWILWWDANADKPWDELARANPVASGELGRSRRVDHDRLKDAKVLAINAGTRCKCKKDHDLDDGIRDVLAKMPFKTEWVTKEVFEYDPEEKYTNDKLKAYTIVIALPTNFREHCACPKCQAGGTPTLRIYTCTGCDAHDPTRFCMGKKGTSKLRKYVDAGGYLFTEDWALEEILEPEWGDVVKHSTYVKRQQVPALPPRGTGTHPYLRRTFTRPSVSEMAGVEWSLDEATCAVSIVNKSRVTVLLSSETLLYQTEKDAGSDALAVTFSSTKDSDPVKAGRAIPQNPAEMKGGRVLHVMTRFGLDAKADDLALRNLLVNFLIEANERTPLRK